MKYAIRLAADDCPERDVADLLCRPLRRPCHKPPVHYKGFLYEAATWTKARQRVATPGLHFAELLPQVGFIVTNPEADSPGRCGWRGVPSGPGTAAARG